MRIQLFLTLLNVTQFSVNFNPEKNIFCWVEIGYNLKNISNFGKKWRRDLLNLVETHFPPDFIGISF